MGLAALNEYVIGKALKKDFQEHTALERWWQRRGGLGREEGGGEISPLSFN